MTFALPPNLVDSIRSDPEPGRRAWLDRLPDVVGDVAARWQVTLGEAYQPGGCCSWVGPAVNAAGEKRVLKVGLRHAEADHEADGLRVWNGDGAVLVYAADAWDDYSALLLERCTPGTPLARARSEPEQDHVIAGLLTRLWNASPDGRRFRPLPKMCDAWAADYVGDLAYDVVQHLLNCARLLRDPRGLAARMAGLLDLDPQRVLQWLFARCVLESIDQPAFAGIAARLAPRL